MNSFAIYDTAIHILPARLPHKGTLSLRDDVVRGTLLLDLGNNITMRFVIIPAGEFLMGSSDNETGQDGDEGPQHTVRLSKPIAMAATEVTQEQYEHVMGTNPSKFRALHNPVEQVSWADAVAFCKKLSDETGMNARLPSEAQWEYACRAGAKTGFRFGEDDKRLGSYAWHIANSDSQTHPVATKKPNAWGLYDMHGNVYEWCRDWHNGYPVNSMTDPEGPAEGTYRVLRGGAWHSNQEHCRSTNRYRNTPDYWFNGIGFRIVLELK
jgi:formylglycine-generating enzyme required for sulfatase activity